MEAPTTMYQLIILYLLHRAGGEVTMPMISGFLIENGYVDFESLVRTWSEIEANGFISIRSSGDTKFLSLTEEGRQTLQMFQKNLTNTVMRQADEFLKQNGRKLTQDRSIIGEYYKASYGGYTAHLCIKEQNTVLISIDLNMPTEEAAREAAAKWKQNHTEAYQKLIEILF